MSLQSQIAPATTEITVNFSDVPDPSVTIFSNDSNFGLDDDGVTPVTTPLTYEIKIFLVAEGGN